MHRLPHSGLVRFRSPPPLLARARNFSSQLTLSRSRWIGKVHPRSLALHRLDDDGHALPAADARGADGTLLPHSAERIGGVREDARSRGAERMAERDRAAADVGLAAIEAK